jgi:hypothetical protein
MNASSRASLARRRELLALECELDRQLLGVRAAPLREVCAYADAGRNVLMEAKRHPLVTGVSLGALALLLRRFQLGRALLGWRLFRLARRAIRMAMAP